MPSHSLIIRIGPLALAAALAAALAPRDASACGGTFCDRGPPGSPPMPVDQTGENIAFVMSPTHVEAHVQIQYTGIPEKFAWIIPMPKFPEVSVGSQLFFDSLLAATVPTISSTSSFDRCVSGTSSGSGSFDCIGSELSSASGDSAVPASAPGGGLGAGGSTAGGPSVTRKEVGSFAIDLLQGGTTQGLLSWLETNNYDIPSRSSELLEHYVQAGYVFVGVKIRRGVDSDEIHPLVFRYEGQTPCIPLKLTAIAAVEDMAVRAFFLDTKRWFPRNWAHVEPNDLRFTYPGPFQGFGAGGSPPGQTATGYTQVIGRAIDSPGASGRAFVTEYAGPQIASAAPLQQFATSKPDVSRSTPETIVPSLASVLSCNPGATSCQAAHPLVIPTLEEFLPRPAGVSEADFYRCVSCYEGQYDASKFDAEALDKALDERIFAPARHAASILTSQPYLTRLFTTISPAEMTEDPEFIARGDLGNVTRSYAATFRTTCSQQIVVTPPSGRSALADSGATQQGATLAFGDSMPYALRVETIPDSGPPIVVADNSSAIDRTLSAYNEARGGITPPPEFGITKSNGCATSRPRNASVALALSLAAAALAARRRARP